ncbi:hypothetical protein MP228_005980 [Amoeboaphelidium protococcarum]|nr:hypothetical protein MP228_005980 [Amoeboaphelidium protococcarum]
MPSDHSNQISEESLRNNDCSSQQQEFRQQLEIPDSAHISSSQSGTSASTSATTSRSISRQSMYPFPYTAVMPTVTTSQSLVQLSSYPKVLQQRGHEDSEAIQTLRTAQSMIDLRNLNQGKPQKTTLPIPLPAPAQRSAPRRPLFIRSHSSVAALSSGQLPVPFLPVSSPRSWSKKSEDSQLVMSQENINASLAGTVDNTAKRRRSSSAEGFESVVADSVVNDEAGYHPQSPKKWKHDTVGSDLAFKEARQSSNEGYGSFISSAMNETNNNAAQQNSSVLSANRRSLRSSSRQSVNNNYGTTRLGNPGFLDSQQLRLNEIQQRNNGSTISTVQQSNAAAQSNIARSAVEDNASIVRSSSYQYLDLKGRLRYANSNINKNVEQNSDNPGQYDGNNAPVAQSKKKISKMPLPSRLNPLESRDVQNDLEGIRSAIQK